MPVARGEEKRVALSGAMDGDFQTRFPNKLAKLAVYVLAFVVLGVAYGYPELAPTLVVGSVAVMVLVVWLGLRQSGR